MSVGVQSDPTELSATQNRRLGRAESHTRVRAGVNLPHNLHILAYRDLTQSAIFWTINVNGR